MARIWNPSARRVLNGISLAMLSMVPGHAIVIHSGSSPAEKARMEARSHAAGMKHTFVVGIEIDALMDGEATESCSIATGVYLGESGDGTKGLILTAAHLFLDDPDGGTNRPQRLRVFFKESSGSIDAAKTIQVAARRALVHPECRYHRYDKPYAGTSLTTGKSMIGRDLAIVEFDAPSHRAVLAKAGIQPAELNDGTGYLTPLIEAEIVGFGLFGFSASPALADRFQPYAGRTRVSYGDWRGSKGFLHWSPPRKAGHGPHPDPLSNNVQFTLVQEPIKATNPFDQSPIPIWSHPQQALITSGDSGGPLLFRSQGKTKVAGISSSIYGEFLYLGLELVPFHLQIWEPVKDSLEWIHGVMAGNAKASSRVVELGKDEAKAGSGQHGERMASELANEGFAMPCPCVIL